MSARRTLAWWVASGLGSGACPVAPGTAGSLVGLALGAGLLACSKLVLLAAVILVAYGGLWAIQAATGQDLRGPGKGEDDDPGWVVIDEIAGQMLALLALPRLGPLWLAAAFLLFRLFDIAKPGPIGWADRQSGAAGIMADDLLAGVAAAALLLALAHL
jgi:phosphatidylglycerophosphatase A